MACLGACSRRDAYPLTAPAVSPATIRFWKITTNTINGTVIVTVAALDRLGDAPELYAVTANGPEPIAIANRVQAWTIGARFALEHRWDGRLTP